MKKLLNFLVCVILTVLLLIAANCANRSSSFWHDQNNACFKGPFYNATECEYWKSHFPREHRKYELRLKKYGNKYMSAEDSAKYHPSKLGLEPTQ